MPSTLQVGSGSIASLNIFQTVVFLTRYADFNLNVLHLKGSSVFFYAKLVHFKYLFRFICKIGRTKELMLVGVIYSRLLRTSHI